MIATIVIGATVAAGFAALGSAKIAKVPSMRERAEHVGFTAESYQLIGVAEVLGAAGVLTGLAYPPVGFVAGAGLLLLLAGAVRAHLRSGDGFGEVAPALLFGALTVAYLDARGLA